MDRLEKYDLELQLSALAVSNAASPKGMKISNLFIPFMCAEKDGKGAELSL